VRKRGSDDRNVCYAIVVAFCDPLDFDKLLFPADWGDTVTAAGNMETCEAVVHIKKHMMTRASGRK